MPTAKKSPAKKSPAKKSPAKKSPAKPTGPVADGFDEDSGAASLARVKPALLSLPRSQLVPIYFSVRLAATFALGLAAWITEHKLRGDFEKLAAAGLFDLSLLDGLSDRARALYYIRHRLDEQSALASDAGLPTALSETATHLRRDMLRVLEFRLADDPEVSARLDFIRRGAGHQDLADDLLRLAGLYRQHQAALRDMPAPYAPKDGERAAELSSQILVTLGLSPALEKSSDGARVSKSAASAESLSQLQIRAAMLLRAAYDEVAAAGRYLFRADPEYAARFAPLASIARSRSGAPSPSPDKDPAPEAPKPPK